MPEPRVLVVVPTLAAGPNLVECLVSLLNQSERALEVTVVDNSGRALARQAGAERLGAAVLENPRNVGFGAAINAAFRRSQAPFLATLNDDAVAHPDWLGALLSALAARPDAGMGASQVRLRDEPRLDSAGMLIGRDGATKQRGHGQDPAAFSSPEEVLFPSGSAALYRRAMLEQIGLFDEDFFLYCEDSDLGLRARWAGWTCLYVPTAVVEHRYSETAGAASALKAYYVERNRLFLVTKNFPARKLAATPFFALARYFWHAFSILEGVGSAARFQRARRNPLELAFIVLRAHCAWLVRLPRLWHERRRIRQGARLSADQFSRLLAAHGISAREVAAQ